MSNFFSSIFSRRFLCDRFKVSETIRRVDFNFYFYKTIRFKTIYQRMITLKEACILATTSPYYLNASNCLISFLLHVHLPLSRMPQKVDADWQLYFYIQGDIELP